MERDTFFFFLHLKIFVFFFFKYIFIYIFLFKCIKTVYSGDPEVEILLLYFTNVFYSFFSLSIYLCIKFLGICKFFLISKKIKFQSYVKYLFLIKCSKKSYSANYPSVLDIARICVLESLKPVNTL